MISAPVRRQVLDADTVDALAAWVGEIEAWPAGSHAWGHYAEATEHGPVICRTENVSVCHPGIAGLSSGVLRDLAEIVADVVPGSRVVITGETGADPRSYRVDFGRAAGAFPGFVQAWDARRGAEDLRDRYAEFGLSESDRSRFVRLRWLQGLKDAGRVDDDLRFKTPVG